MAWFKRWLDREMQDPAPDVDKAARSARFGLGMSFWAAVGLMGLFLVSYLVRWLVFDADDGGPFDVVGILGLAFAIQAMALLGRENYHRKLLEERVKALEARA